MEGKAKERADRQIVLVEGMYRRRYAGRWLAWLRAELRIHYACLVLLWRPLPKPVKVVGTCTVVIGMFGPVAGSLGFIPLLGKVGTYRQEWANYNLAQQNEKDMFLILLRDLCSTVSQRPQGRGRPRIPMADMLFAVTYKVYSGFSARRFTSDIKAARQSGLIDHAPHFNSTNRYLASDDLTEHLKALVELSAGPLAAVEVNFAIDSTGFSTTTYRRWYDHMWGKERSKQTWVKTHLMSGVKTNIVTAAHATIHESADSKQLPGLLARTAETFTVDEVSADKAYSSKNNLRAVEAVGATPYIPFKSYSTGHQRKDRYDSLWDQMWHFYAFNREEFNAHYHKRSNAETTMFMIKTKFGGSVKSKSPTAQVNEVLCKVLCHNVCVLVQSFYELGIEATFETLATSEPKIIDLNQYRARPAT